MIVTDDFNRADGAIPSDNNPYTTISQMQSMSVVSNACRPTNYPNDSGVSYTNAAFSNDQYAQCTINNLDGGSSGGQGIGVSLRDTPGAQANFYRIIVQGNGEVEVAKFVANTYTALGGTIAAGFALSGDVLRVEIGGTTISVYKNGILQGTRTDSSHTSGYPGVIYSSNLGSCTVDNFEAGDLSTIEYHLDTHNVTPMTWR